MVMISHKAKHPPNWGVLCISKLSWGVTLFSCFLPMVLPAFLYIKTAARTPKNPNGTSAMCAATRTSPRKHKQATQSLLVSSTRAGSFLDYYKIISVIGEQVDFPHILGNPNFKGNHTRLECHQHVLCSLSRIVCLMFYFKHICY